MKLFRLIPKKTNEWRFAFLGVIVVLFASLLVACPNPASSAATPANSNGTLTFTITGAAAYNGKGIGGAVIPTGATLTPSNFLADNGGVQPIITGGTASILFKAKTSGSPTWIGTGGSKYDVYVIVDVDGDGVPTLNEPSIGGTTSSVTISGDTTITKPLTDFTPWAP